MGQTLSNGVYLPNEGERNCYAGLASNWQILNTAVGNIAEKAPLVHTHGNITNDGKVGTTANLPLITGTGGAITAGAFGTSANTFCEGNDSRLSDARTPVAHTHTKSDVTDLLNSNFIPSANNSYDLGSSSYQWNNLYAKNYYYNGVAWGLDKANTWSGENIFVSSLSKRNNAMTLGTAPANTIYNSLFFKDKNDTLIASLDQQFNTDGSARFVLRIAPNQSGASRVVAWEYIHDGTNRTMTFNATLSPVGGDHSLGTSTNKWKTLNGINPGALSIPDGADSGANSSFTPDTTDWPKDGTAFQATMPIVGWLRITIKNVTGNYAFVRRGTAGANQPWQIFADPSSAADFTELTLNVPVTNGTYTLKINSSGGFTAKVYPCLGNV